MQRTKIYKYDSVSVSFVASQWVVSFSVYRYCYHRIYDNNGSSTIPILPSWSDNSTRTSDVEYPSACSVRGGGKEQKGFTVQIIFW